MKNNNVVTNLAQDFDASEKAQGRANIDAAGITSAFDASGNLVSSGDITFEPDSIYVGGTEVMHLVQSDWNENDSASLAYIQNKPAIPAAQVQSDWVCNVSADPSYIRNKPSIPQIYQNYGILHSDTVQTMDVDMLASKKVKFTTPQGVESYPGFFVPLIDEDSDEGKALVAGPDGWPIWDNVSGSGGSNINIAQGGAYGPTYTHVDKMDFWTGGRVSTTYNGGSSVEDQGYLSPWSLPAATSANYNQVLGWTSGGAAWMPNYPAVGRNLWLNQNFEVQTNLPGGHITLDRVSSDTWTKVGQFGGSFALMARYNTQATTSYVQLAIRYLASGYTSHFTFVGTQTVGSGSTVNTKILKYINTTSVYTPQQIGDSLVDAGTTDNDVLMLAGTMDVVGLHDFRCSIWYDNSDSKYHVAFTAVEIGKVGATN